MCGTVLKRDSILREAEASLQRLGVDAIDLYQIHWPIPEEDIEEGWAALAELKEQGLVRHIGVSNFNAEQLRRIQQIAPVETLQPPYSLVDAGVEEEMLPFAEREGIGVIVYSPMGSGLLTGAMTRERIARLPDDDWRKTDARFTEPQLSRHLALVDRLQAIGDRHRRHARCGRGGLDAAQPGGRRRDHRLPPARPGGPDRRPQRAWNSPTRTSPRSKGALK